MNQQQIYSIRRQKYSLNINVYFVDENKYIMERVAMFSLLSFIEQKTQQAKTFANKVVGMNLPVYDFNDLIIRHYSNASDYRILA